MDSEELFLTNTCNWPNEVEDLLEKLRINCVNLSEYHRKRYYKFKGYGKYFRLPIIVLASINSTASVGLQPVLQQGIISAITCLIGMIMGILGALELYLGIQTNMDLELKQSKEFYTLAIDIYRMLTLRREHRGEDGKDYLNKKYSNYIKLCEASNLFKRHLRVDLLTNVPNEVIDFTPQSSKLDFEMENRMVYRPRPSLGKKIEMTTKDSTHAPSFDDLNNNNQTNQINQFNQVHKFVADNNADISASNSYDNNVNNNVNNSIEHTDENDNNDNNVDDKV